MTRTAPAGALRSPRTSTERVGLAGSSPVDVRLVDRDRTRPFLLLHGGGGPVTMSAFADLLAERTHSRVLVPTHPGFGGTPRPEPSSSTVALAQCYVDLLDELDLADVTVVGNSFGGRVAAEIGLLASPRVSGVVLVDLYGLEVDGHPYPDIASMTPDELVAHSFHDPALAPAPRSGSGAVTPDVAALAAYAGPTLSDPTLLGRLAALEVPAHVVWGASDRIVDTAHGEALAAAIPVSHLTVLPRAGHLPQLEVPEELLGALWDLGRPS